jgi:hypothetical protein
MTDITVSPLEGVELTIIEPDEIRITEVGIQGPAGAQGLTGPTGPQGEAGPPLDTYRHVQSIAAASWVIVHGLGRYPSVTVVDSSRRVVMGQVTYDSNMQVTIVFSAAFAGEALIN